jgi:hypothetical protein
MAEPRIPDQESFVSDPSKKRRQHDGAPLSTKVGGQVLPAVGLAILVAGSLAAWLRSRRTQPVIDAQTARRLSLRSVPAELPAASAPGIVIGEPADARSSS